MASLVDFRVQMAKDVGQTVAETLENAKCTREMAMEPKYNGWRCVIVVDADGRVHIYKPSRSKDKDSIEYTGKLPELEADLAKLPAGTILDGELVAVSFDGERYIEDFFRIHTVMRSNETIRQQRDGITLIAFDVIESGGDRSIASKDLNARREVIQGLIDSSGLEMVKLTMQMEVTQENHDSLAALGFEGTVIKCVDKPYAFGKRGHGWFKIKEVRTIDCVVMEVVMDGKGQHLGKAGRMHVGQFKDGVLTRVASVNCLNNRQRDEATADPDSFVGRVIEVKIYGWDTKGPRHPTPMRFRDGDKDPDDCVWSRV